MERVSSISDASFLAGFKVDKNNFKKRPIFAIYRGSDRNEDKETMQWGEWDDPSLQVLHCTTTTSSPKLTQIGKEEFSLSLDHFFQPPKSTFYTQNVPS